MYERCRGKRERDKRIKKLSLECAKDKVMTIDFLTVFITVFSLIVLMLPGYLLAKLKMIGKGAESVLSVLVLYCCQPMLMIKGFQTQYNSSIAVNMLIVARLALVVHMIMIGIMFLVLRNKNNDAKINCVRFASVFSNCGYMGLPFLNTLFAGNNEVLSQIIIYGAVVIAVFNFLNWSIGIYMMTGNKKDISVKNALLNPTVIAILIGLLLFLTVQTPFVDLAKEGTALDLLLTKLMQSVNFLAEMVTPLAMMVIGVKLANVKLKSLFLDKWAYLSSFFKLIVMSLVAMLCVAFLPIDTVVKYAIFFCLSMPSATGTVLFAVRFGGDADSASVCVLLSTVLSIITIPLMFLVFSGIFGVVM